MWTNGAETILFYFDGVTQAMVEAQRTAMDKGKETSVSLSAPSVANCHRMSVKGGRYPL